MMAAIRRIYPFVFLSLFMAVAGHQEAHAQGPYNRFQPANGILVGQTSTYVTTAADATDVISLWTGTCNASTFLRGDGSCQLVTTAPGGSDTQVQYNDGGAFGGDAGMTYNEGTDTLTVGSIVGNGSGLSSLDAGDISTGTLGVPRGGTGAATLSGVLLGNGTSAIGSAASSDVISLWTGTCNASTFLRADGSCQTAGGGTPGGSDTQVQYNNAGAFAGDAGMTYNAGTDTLTVGTDVVVNSQSVCLENGTNCPAASGVTAQCVYTTANTDLQNDDTVNLDATLQMASAFAINSSYRLTIILPLTGFTGTTGFKWGLGTTTGNFPWTGSGFTSGWFQYNPAATTSNDSHGWGNAGTTTLPIPTSAATNLSRPSNGSVFLMIQGFFRTPGTVSDASLGFWWAQGTSTANLLRIQPGASMCLEKLQ